MASLTRKPFADKETLSGEDYFQSVLSYALSNGFLSEDKAFFIRQQLFCLMEKQTRRFTMGDSSSIPAETSGELLQSICFCIGVYMKQADDEYTAIELLKTKSVENLFLDGQATAEKLFRQGKILFRVLQSCSLNINNAAYLDTTFKSLLLFFRSYDIRFMAHDIPCDIDYPLSSPVPALSGIEYMNEYMRRLQTENLFCRKFSPELITRLMEAYCGNFTETIVNIFEAVFFNAIGLAVLNKDLYKLEITANEKTALSKITGDLSPAALQSLIDQSAAHVCDEFQLETGSFIAYTKEARAHLFIRLTQQLKTGDLDALFISFKEEPITAGQAEFYDGIQMPDEDLRKLIEEINGCGSVKDKTELIKREIHSLADLVEITGACFATGECVHVFRLLNDLELSFIFKKLYDKKGDLFFDRIQNVEWENEFLDYINTLETPRLDFIQRPLLAGFTPDTQLD